MAFNMFENMFEKLYKIGPRIEPCTIPNQVKNLSNRFYQPTINFLLITIPNGKGNLLIIAGVWL